MRGLAAALVVGVLALVIAAVGTTGASAEPAEPPSFGRCDGNIRAEPPEYSDGLCSSTAGELSWWWEPIPVSGFHPEELFSTGRVILSMPAGEMRCSEFSFGTFVGPKRIADFPLAFARCTRAGQECNSPAQTHGVVQTSTLEGTLGYAESVVGSKRQVLSALELSPEEGAAPFAQFSCGSTQVTLRGAVTAHMFTQERKFGGRRVIMEFKVSKMTGQQAITHLEGAADRQLEASVGGGEWTKVTIHGNIVARDPQVIVNDVSPQP